ncbi:MAG: purine-nucleoside phosphorylase [Chthoniobacteraceae bacterium]
MNDWRDLRPEWGIVLGSGLGGLVDHLRIDAEVPYADIPEVPKSGVPGHAGKFVFGHLGETSVVIAQGRAHLYEGWSAREITAHVRWMEQRGIRKLILTNAAGTMNPEFAPGSWMLVTDHLNLTGTSLLLGGPHFVDMTEVYSRHLGKRFIAAAKIEGMTLHQGVYAAVLGPQYETPAEIRMLRALGADAVGMSTVLEAVQARAVKLEVAAISCLTNWAAGMGGTALSHEEVITTGRDAAPPLVLLLDRVIGE